MIISSQQLLDRLLTINLSHSLFICSIPEWRGTLTQKSFLYKITQKKEF